MNPYLVLGVPVDANDQPIRRAYLAAIKEATPEANPKRFQQISEAYEKIKDEPHRLNYCLFNQAVPGDSPADVFIRFARLQPQPKPLPFEAMKEFLRVCSKT